MAEFPKHPFLLSVAETADALSTDVDKGLTSAQVAQMQEKYPKNELDVGDGIAWYKILTKQILNAMIIVSLFFFCPLLSARLPTQGANLYAIGPYLCHGS